MTPEFHPIQTQADIDHFLDCANGLHDGYLVGVDYAHRGHTCGNPHFIDPDRSELRLRWLVTSIHDRIVELVFTAPRKWQLREEGWDITDTAVSFSPDGAILWASDTAPDPDSFVIAQAMHWRFL